MPCSHPIRLPAACASSPRRERAGRPAPRRRDPIAAATLGGASGSRRSSTGSDDQRLICARIELPARRVRPRFCLTRAQWKNMVELPATHSEQRRKSGTMNACANVPGRRSRIGGPAACSFLKSVATTKDRSAFDSCSSLAALARAEDGDLFYAFLMARRSRAVPRLRVFFCRKRKPRSSPATNRRLAAEEEQGMAASHRPAPGPACSLSTRAPGSSAAPKASSLSMATIPPAIFRGRDRHCAAPRALPDSGAAARKPPPPRRQLVVARRRARGSAARHPPRQLLGRRQLGPERLHPADVSPMARRPPRTRPRTRPRPALTQFLPELVSGRRTMRSWWRGSERSGAHHHPGREVRS